MSTYQESDRAAYLANGNLHCLEDCADYSRLNRRNLFMWKYYRVLAILPFALTLAFLRATKAWYGLGSAMVYASLVWALALVVYLFILFVRLRLFRCPRCGWRFGGSIRCGSCDLPRTR